MATTNTQQLPRSSWFGSWGIVGLVIAGVLLIVGLVSAGRLFENLDAKHIMVIQSPIDGRLDVYTEPGIKWQGFGQVTTYPRRTQYEFNIRDILANGQAGPKDTSKRLRFNDGGHGNLYGAVSWEMPLKPETIIKIHKTFGSAEAVENQAVSKMIDGATYLAGPLMSSTESSGERRAELVQYINDQSEHGVYVTRARTVVSPPTKGADGKDIPGTEKTTIFTEIVLDEKGQPKRQQGSILGEFDIKLFPLSINELKYDNVVEDQIKQRQKATTEVQISQANARRAQQDTITTEEQGKATAAKAKWEQETIKAKFVTEAQQKLEVATLAAKEAEQYKKSQILIGEGDAQRKRLVMEADGALDPKLQAYKEVNAKYAEAIAAAHPGAWSPVVQMGQSANATGGSAQTLIDLFTAKAARDLGLDMSIQGAGNTAQGKDAPAKKK